MIRFLVYRPVAVLVSFFALLLLGLTAYFFLPTSLLPNTDVPEISIRIKGNQLSAREVETRLTTPLRNSLQQLRNLDKIESQSTDGMGLIRLYFNYDTDISMRFLEVNEKVDMAMSGLPREAERPMIIKTGVDDIPIFQLNISAKDSIISDHRMVEISALTQQTIRKRIEQLSEIAMVDVTGLTTSEVRILPKAGLLKTLSIKEEVLSRALEEQKIGIGDILVKDGQYEYYLKFSSGIRNLSGLAASPLLVNGRLFRLSDLAEVELTSVDEGGGFYSNGRPAINVAVFKQPSARMENLTDNFDDLLHRMRADYPDLDFQIAQDQTKLLNYATGNLRQDLWLGGMLAFLLMLVFIRRLKPALLIGITIPLSLVLSQLGFYFFDISINIISLGGLILGLGMIIDNSIVVIDTIKRHADSGLDSKEAAIQGTNEIMRPLITSVLTNCAVFIPLIFMSDLAGAIFSDQAISVTIGIVASLVVSLILLPPLYGLLYQSGPYRGRKTEYEIKSVLDVSSWYEYGLRWVFHNKWITFFLVASFVLVGMIAYFDLPKDRLPEITRTAFEVSIDWNEIISTDESWVRVNTLLSEIGDGASVTNSWIGRQQYLLDHVGEQNASQASFFIAMPNEIKINSIRTKLHALSASRYPYAALSVKPTKNALEEIFADREAPIRVSVQQKDARNKPPLDRITMLLDSIRRKLPGIQLNPITTVNKVDIRVNPNKAAQLGVSMSNITDRIESAFKPLVIDYYQEAYDLVPIVLTPKMHENFNKLLSNTFIPRQDAGDVPLSALVDIEYERDYKYINATSYGEYYPIDINTAYPQRDLNQLKVLMASSFSDVDSFYSGAYFDNQQLLAEMVIILSISTLLLYFILSAQFESLIQPLFILVELPVAMSGALLFLYVMGGSINLMSLIGIVVMSGLIINDSILKIDAINQLRRQGKPLLDAIYEGGHKRIKPIIMITLTSIGALLPTLFMDDLGSELQQPLALALIGGMTSGLLVSLFFVPLLYWLVYRGNDSTTRIEYKKC